MARPQDVAIPLAQGPGPLAGRLYLPAGRPRAAAVISHGLLSSMDSEKLSLLASALALGGYAAVIFDHSGCGRSPGKLTQTTLRARAAEVVAAGRWLAAEVGEMPMVLIGSSLGGTAVALAAAELAPACTVHWSTPWFFTDLLQRLRSQPPGERLNSLMAELAGMDMSPVLASLANALVIHGEKDEVVNVDQARRGYELLAEPKALHILPGADHRFTDPLHRRQAIEYTLEWISLRL